MPFMQTVKCTPNHTMLVLVIHVTCHDNIAMNIIQIPTLVDVHVHLREPGATQKEDFETGTKSAVAGGYTQILDMPNNTPPTTTPEALSQKAKLAKGRIWCDLGFNFGATADSAKYFDRVQKNVFGLKVYMNQTTGPLLVDKSKDLNLIFKSWKSHLPIMVHAQGETMETAISLAKKYKRRLHICHITAGQISTVSKAKKEGLSISSEVCPHHLFLDVTDVKKLGPLGMMKPPLLTKSEQKKLWQNLDKIDMISTDHAPHTLEEKSDESSPKFGVPGLETTLPLMLNAMSHGLISQDRLIEMTSGAPRRIFHLPDQPNTYVQIDLSKQYTIGNKNLYTKCAWTPFAGKKGRGIIKNIVLRGKSIFKDGKFQGKPSGRITYPNSHKSLLRINP